MTCREKLRLEHPEFVDVDSPGGCYSCPSTFRYLPDPDDQWCKKALCTDCWNREIPETEIKKENDIMPTHDINYTKMTKAQMVEEIHRAHEHIQEMEAQIKNLERYKQYEDMANEMKAMHTAFMNSGFSDEQAFDMVKMLVKTVVPTALRGMGL